MDSPNKDTITPEELQVELENIKQTLIHSTKKLKQAVEQVLKSSAMDLTPNLIILKSALADSNSDVENSGLK